MRQWPHWCPIMKILIRHGQVLHPGAGLAQGCDIALAAGRIVGLNRVPPGFVPDRVLDADGCLVLPGLVDLAARLREPGHEPAGVLGSEMAAAVAGGVASLVCPPNTDPALDEPGVVEKVQFRPGQPPASRLVPPGAL